MIPGTLFYFLRKVPRTLDEEFVNDVQDYLSRVLGVLVRIGGWRQHLLILAHILCCPPGVGLWAVNFVQCPAENADHACALLFVLLRPVDCRQEFLKHRLGDCQWSVVDDDGLDMDADCGAVCENVLFQLLDQVSFLLFLLRIFLLFFPMNSSSFFHRIFILVFLHFFCKFVFLFSLTFYSFFFYEFLFFF